MNTIVNNEIVKILKEKGYKDPEESNIPFYYKSKDLSLTTPMYNPIGNLVNITMPRVATLNKFCFAPTIGDVVMWIYEKHGIWISVAPRFNNDNSLWFVYESLILSTNTIKTLNNNLFKGHFNEMFKSPTETYLAAILYTLNNLI